MKAYRMAAALLAVAFLLSLRVTAAEEGTGAVQASYLIQLEEPQAAACPDLGIRVVDAEHGLYAADTLAAARSFTKGKDVEAVEKNQSVTLFDAPNDPYIASGVQWDRSALDVDGYWAGGLTGSGVRVGVLDTGVYREHQDFAGSTILQGYDFVEKDIDPQDTNGHGTLVTGIIAATANDGLGIAGIAPEVEIVPLKCFDGRKGSMEHILQAIYAAVDDYHCDILNMSFGTDSESALLEAAIRYASERGVLLVAAAGNDGTAASVEDALNYPAAYEEVIGVGSVNKSLQHAATSQKNSSVLVCAPGERIIGPAITGEAAYVTNSGTSFAAPCISGLLALAKAQEPDAAPEELTQALCDSAVDLGDEGWDSSYGWGLPQLPGLLRRLAAPPDILLEDGAGTAAWPSDKAFPPGTMVLAAAYNSAGALAEAVLTAPGTDGQAAFQFTGSWAQVKVFYLDETLAPCCPAGAAAQ